MKPRSRTWPCLLLVLLVLGCARAYAAGVQATLDRDHVSLGGTVTLTLKSDSSAAMASPDLSPLRKNFQILGQSSSAEQSWVNGRVHASNSLQVTLRPRRAGTLRIPSIDLGGQHTRVLTLHVTPGSNGPVGKPGDPVFVKVKLSTQTPYVGEQVAMDVRLYYQAALINGNRPVPDITGARVTHLGRMQRYQTDIGGQRYFVAEAYYAIVPRHPGKLAIPPVQFHGQVVNTSAMGTFFSNARPVNAHSRAYTLTVRPRPASAGKGRWLPARHLELSLDGLPASGKLQVGQPVTVTLREGATGLSAAALPSLSLPKLPGADVYPDKSHVVTRNDAQWITGSRMRRFAIVPNRKGTLQIPPITLHWWNVVKDKAETARIPAQALTVVAAGASSSGSAPVPAASAPAPAGTSAPVPATPVPAPATRASGQGSATAPPPAHVDIWRVVALASLLAWLGTMLVLAGWWWRRRRRRQDATGSGADHEVAASGSARSRRLAFLGAARAGDPRVTAQALLAWARVERPRVRHLQDLAEQLDDAAQRHVVEHLQRAMFAPQAGHDELPDNVTTAFRQGLSWRKESAPGEDEDLPPLYPRSRD